MLTERVHQEHRLRARDDPSFTYDLTLGSLIQHGVSDALSDNCEHIASTRAMRHSSAMGNRLWMLLDRERERMHQYEGELGDRLNEVEDLGVAFDRKFDVFEQHLCRCDRPVPPELSGTGTADEPFVLGSELSYAGTPEPEGPAVASGSSSDSSYHSPPVATPTNSDHDVPLPLPTPRIPLADITGCCR